MQLDDVYTLVNLDSLPRPAIDPIEDGGSGVGSYLRVGVVNQLDEATDRARRRLPIVVDGGPARMLVPGRGRYRPSTAARGRGGAASSFYYWYCRLA